MTKTLLWALFVLIDAYLFLPWLFIRIITRFRVAAEPQVPFKTVVIVGASFSGLAAYREFQKWSNRRNARFRIILLDQKDYFEYTPGILRLFCEPSLFPKLAKSLSSYNGFIQGRVVRISATRVTYLESPTKTSPKSIPFDYLIMATGSTYSYPISPSPTSEIKLDARARGWYHSAAQLQNASSILILGGGAVGTELAAEIVDHDSCKRKSVTIVEASPTLLPLFPRATSRYAEEWLRKRGVNLILGDKLQSWDDVSCRLQNGTVLKADLVFVCFGNDPNSAPLLQPQNSLRITGSNSTRKQFVKVDAYLRAGTPNVFCCGDVAEPPTEGLKQAFHAEAMGHLAAENVIRTAAGRFPLHLYPEDLTGGVDKMPFVTVLSLGQYDGVIGFNSLSVAGPLSAIMKWIIEWTKIEQMLGKPLGCWIWLLGDAVAYFVSRIFLRPVSKTK